MVRESAPGLGGEWLNGWLAAIGVTVLLEDSRLSWSDSPTPTAYFDHPGPGPLASALANAFPSERRLASMALARLGRTVTLEGYRVAAASARQDGDESLSLSSTDLVSGRRFDESKLQHGPFDPPAPRGTTLHLRLMSCRRLIGDEDLEQRIARTLSGYGEREQTNGLGFDVRRVPSGAQPDAEIMVDPVIECLCFAGLGLFPVRGDGRQLRQRGWTGAPSRIGSFAWPIWTDPLDAWAIDALLDRFHADGLGKTWALLGISGAFASIPYQPRGTSDVTRAYGSKRLEMP